jgi:trans-aconitate 2-methyltransferase
VERRLVERTAARMAWDPRQYARYRDERSRPFFDLIAQVGTESPGCVLDVGCGSGELTVTLSERWPNATVRGVDSSAEMIASTPSGSRVSFSVRAAQDLDAVGVDVLVSNAALQWVPQHPELLTTWAGQLNDDGWIAFQVPSNFGAPSHRLMAELADSPQWRDRLEGVLRGALAVREPEEYLDLMTAQGLHTEVWQTEYLHVLGGENPVLAWVAGTGLRPILAALEDDEAARFTAEYAAMLLGAYPRRSYGTVFGFLRTFVVAHKGS